MCTLFTRVSRHFNLLLQCEEFGMLMIVTISEKLRLNSVECFYALVGPKFCHENA